MSHAHFYAFFELKRRRCIIDILKVSLSTKFKAIFSMVQETQLLPHRRNLQDLLCDSSLCPKAYISVSYARSWLFMAHILGVCF